MSEPGGAARRAAGEAYRLGAWAPLEQGLDVDAVFERDALEDGPRHMRQPLPGGEADEGASGRRGVEPAVRIGQEIKGGVVGRQGGDGLVAPGELGGAVGRAARPHRLDEPFEGAGRGGAAVHQHVVPGPRSERATEDRPVRRGRAREQLVQPPGAGDHVEAAVVGDAQRQKHGGAIREAG